MHSRSARIVSALLSVLAFATCAAPSPALEPVARDGGDLSAGGRPFQAWGFNYGLGERYPILDFFDRPTRAGLATVASDMRRARALGANTLRIYLELRAFMRSPSEPNRRALAGLADLLERAERLGLYLDLTGDLVCRAPPRWYDHLSERARWAVQARFWRAVARSAAGSPAVLVYELTSEPAIEDSDNWYCGEFGGYTFVQRIVRDTGRRDRSALARRWIARLSASIRRYDRAHLIGLGLLPQTTGPFAPANVADLLDVLLVHEYPDEDTDAAVSVVREFAAHSRPVVVGETAPLLAPSAEWARFLRHARRHVDGFLSFYDGRAPAEVSAGSADGWYGSMLERFIELRRTLLGRT